MRARLVFPQVNVNKKESRDFFGCPGLSASIYEYKHASLFLDSEDVR